MSGKSGRGAKGLQIKFNLGGQGSKSLLQKLQATRDRQSQLQTQIVEDKVAATKQASAAAPSTQVPIAKAKDATSAAAGAGSPKARELGEATKHLPVGLRLKRVIETLFEAQRPLKAPEILETCKVNVLEVELLGQLKKHDRIVIEGGRFSYRSELNASDAEELLQLLRRNPEGLPMSKLKQTYFTAESDLQKMREEGKVRILGSGIDGLGKVVYPVDMQCRLLCAPELVQLWESVKLPKDPYDIEKELAAAGLKVTGDVGKRRQGSRRELEEATKKRKSSTSNKRLRFTNQHMMEEFRKGGVAENDGRS